MERLEFHFLDSFQGKIFKNFWTKKFPRSKGIHHFENKKIEYRRVQIKTARIKYQLDFDPYLFHENLLETKGAVSRGTANATTKPRSIIPVTRSHLVTAEGHLSGNARNAGKSGNTSVKKIPSRQAKQNKQEEEAS